MTDTTRFTRLTRLVAAPALAAALFVGSAGFAAAETDPNFEPQPVPECRADDGDFTLGNILRNPLTTLPVLIPVVVDDILSGCAEPVEDDF